MYSETATHNKGQGQQPPPVSVRDITLTAKWVARYGLTEKEKATGIVLGARNHSVLPFDPSHLSERQSSSIQQSTDGDPNLFFTCAVLSESQLLLQDWKNEVVRDVLRDIEKRSDNHNHNQRIHYIPFYNITAGRQDFHKVHAHQDCTHYCLSPLMFIGVWDRIVEVLGSQRKGINKSKRG